MTETNKKQYITDVRVMNYLLQAIPNDIYNLVDACKTAQEMWERIKRLMYGSDVTNHVRYSRLIHEFDKFIAKEGESLESMYERLTTLVNIMDRNNVRPITVSINTKFLNCLQHEWSKYVTMFHAKPSYSNSPQPYYVTHPASVIDYEEDYQGELQGDSQEDKLTTAMMLLARAITQKFSTPTNNRLRTSSNTKNQARVPRTESNPRKENVQCYNYNEKGHYAHDCQKPRVRDAKYFREQMLLAMKDEAESNLNAKENDFMLDNYFGDEILEELTTAVFSEVNASHKVHEQVNHVKRKTIIHTFDDDQIDSNIISDDPYVENNCGTSEDDSNAHDQYHDIEILAYNVQREAENKN
uniref:CCHC-type domain-containing protein n=1 Tax=Tanacetum cinerariifolium TaxID=118510 RepID=A0A699HJW0_TANCI|nr:hypothetical protein [Tanacetum cinerariifolium]GFA92868.1 hypothetical protein [Tanacetum cinerariifolium]